MNNLFVHNYFHDRDYFTIDILKSLTGSVSFMTSDPLRFMLGGHEVDP